MTPFDLGPFKFEDNTTIASLVVGFLILVWMARKWVVPGAKAMFADRTAKIADIHNQVEAALADTRRLRDDYAARLARIEQESRERIEAAVKEADIARDQIIAEANESAALVRRRAEEEIARERTRQRILLRQQIVDLTLDAAERSVHEHGDANVQRGLIQEFISTVGKNGGGNGAGKSSAVATTASTEGA